MVSEFAAQNAKSAALRFVVLIGVVSFFAVATYERARSITGLYLAVRRQRRHAWNRSWSFGELVGYGVRLMSGRLANRTGQYWPITLFGYVIQMAAVLLAGLAAGTINTVVGSGTLITFPTLVWTV